MFRRSMLLFVCVVPFVFVLGACLSREMWTQAPGETVYDQVEYDEDLPEDSAIPVWGKALLTPLTLAVDIVTFYAVGFLRNPFVLLHAFADPNDNSPRYPRPSG